MDSDLTQWICDSVARDVGVAISQTSANSPGKLLFHFRDLGRSGGINFELAAGLNRFTVSAYPGSFSRECLEQIRNAGGEQIVSASKHLELAALAASEPIRLITGGVAVESPVTVASWNRTVADDLRVTLIRRSLDDPNSEDVARETVEDLFIPLIGTFAELIGYEASHSHKAEPEMRSPESEGAVVSAAILRRERSRLNRSMCIRIHGCRCKVCGFSFPEFYGPFMDGFIEVHHLEPVSHLAEPRPYDPATDLIPVCANCHRAIHSVIPPLEPDVLVEKIAGMKASLTL